MELFQPFPELSMVTLASLHVFTKNPQYGRLLSGCILTIFVGVMLKKTTKRLIGPLPKSLVMRPTGAFGCNGEQKVDCTNEVGLPSIHSMIAGYYVSATGLRNLQKSWPLLLVPFARLGKADSPLFHHSDAGCHSYPQIAAGFVTGLVLGRFI